MKKWIVLSLALITAAISHAVTVSWVVSNTSYNNINNWAYTTDQGVSTLNFNIHFVYSETALKWSEVYSYDSSTSTQSFAANTTVKVGNVMDDPVDTGNQVLAYANGLPPEPTTNQEVANTVIGSGYYYMVIVKNDDKSQYAVAGTTTEVVFTNGQSNTTGVYASNVGFEPEPENYVDMGWLGGTWRDAVVPEPTVLALLAMGVAGVALRRKQNFLK